MLYLRLQHLRDRALVASALAIAVMDNQVGAVSPEGCLPQAGEVVGGRYGLRLSTVNEVRGVT